MAKGLVCAREQRVAADEGPLRSEGARGASLRCRCVPHRAIIVYGPSQLNAVFGSPQHG
jgi:hypothetical protein